MNVVVLFGGNKMSSNN